MATVNLEHQAFFLKLVDTGVLQVSDIGEVFNTTTNKPHTVRADGFISALDPELGKRREIKLLRLVYLLYVDRNLDVSAILQPIDGNNAAVTNIKVVDKATVRSSATTKKSKVLSESDINKIKYLHSSGIAVCLIAERYGVSASYISQVMRSQVMRSQVMRSQVMCS